MPKIEVSADYLIHKSNEALVISKKLEALNKEIKNFFDDYEDKLVFSGSHDFSTALKERTGYFDFYRLSDEWLYCYECFKSASEYYKNAETLINDK